MKASDIVRALSLRAYDRFAESTHAVFSSEQSRRQIRPYGNAIREHIVENFKVYQVDGVDAAAVLQAITRCLQDRIRLGLLDRKSYAFTLERINILLFRIFKTDDVKLSISYERLQERNLLYLGIDPAREHLYYVSWVRIARLMLQWPDTDGRTRITELWRLKLRQRQAAERLGVRVSEVDRLLRAFSRYCGGAKIDYSTFYQYATQGATQRSRDEKIELFRKIAPRFVGQSMRRKHNGRIDAKGIPGTGAITFVVAGKLVSELP